MRCTNNCPVEESVKTIKDYKILNTAFPFMGIISGSASGNIAPLITVDIGAVYELPPHLKRHTSSIKAGPQHSTVSQWSGSAVD